MKRLPIFKIACALLFLFFFTFAPLRLGVRSSGTALARSLNPITVLKVIDGITIAASGNSVSNQIPLYGTADLGYFSIQVQVTGDGTAKFEYQLSHNGTDYIEPASAADIATGFLKTSGPGSDGKDIFTFQPEITYRLKIKVTETGGADNITVSVWIAIQ